MVTSPSASVMTAERDGWEDELLRGKVETWFLEEVDFDSRCWPSHQRRAVSRADGHLETGPATWNPRDGAMEKGQGVMAGELGSHGHETQSVGWCC